MRLTKSEASRRGMAVLAFFRSNPKSSVAKMNAALVAGTITGQPEKMMNIKRGYELRDMALNAATLAQVEVTAPAVAVEPFTGFDEPATNPVVKGVPSV